MQRVHSGAPPSPYACAHSLYFCLHAGTGTGGWVCAWCLDGGGAQPLGEGAEDEVVGELLIPVSRLPQNEPVEQWYGLEPPAGSGKTFTKAALRLRFLFTTSATPEPAPSANAYPSASASASTSSDFAAAAAAATAEFSGSTGGGGAVRALPGDGAGALAELKGVGGGGGGEGRGSFAARFGWGDGSAGGSDVSGAGGDGDRGGGGRASPGLDGATDEGFRDRTWAPGDSGTDGGGVVDARRRSFTDGEGSGGGGLGVGTRGDGEDFAVNPNIDPFGPDDDGDERGRSVMGDTRPGELTLLRSEQLQLGNWAGTSGGTIHAVSRRGRKRSGRQWSVGV